MREFILSVGAQTLSASFAGTLALLSPSVAPNVNIEILRQWISQSANATSAQQRVQIASLSSPFPLFTAGPAPQKTKRADPNASTLLAVTSAGFQAITGNAGINASSQGTGAETTIMEDNFNVLNGWLNVPTPPETLIFPAQIAASPAAYNMWFPTTPAGLTVWGWGVTFREV